MSVFVKPIIMKMLKENVLFVTTNVQLVPDLVIIVLIVLKTELTSQLVSVLIEPLITVFHYVLNVTKNVKLVKTCQTIVSIVFQVELTHQLVIFQNQMLNQLKLKIFHKLLLES
jgi:hypothetical protein